MIQARPLLERRIIAALDASPRRVAVLVGPCGSGRSSMLMRLRDQIGRNLCQYVDVERVATTPERFLSALREASPFAPPPGTSTAPSASAREAFDSVLSFLVAARAPGGEPATFLLDEALEMRTFESFPGLRTVLRDLVTALSSSPNRFVLASRYTTRAQRLLRDALPQFEIIPVGPLSQAEAIASVGTGAALPLTDDLVRDISPLSPPRRTRWRIAARQIPSPHCPDCSRPASRCSRCAASRTSCGCTVRAGTARSRRSWKCSRSKNR